MRMDEYLSHDATRLAALVRNRDVTPRELLDLARARAEAVNPEVNAVVRVFGEVADERAVDAALRGPFAGVPFLIKDLGQEYRGVVTSSGSRSLRNNVATEHALVTQRFLDAGLVIFGQTNASEFGMKAVTEPDVWGPARNPWNQSHTPGGSSGGSAAAVAAGIVPAAGANDGGGSIRIPAACNGLVGLKASRGLTPYGPQTPELLFGLATEGVVSRTVRDSAALYDAIVGHHGDAAYRAEQPTTPFTTQIHRPPDTLRIGYSYASTVNPAPSPDAITAVEDAAALLSDLGHHVEEVDPPHEDAALARDFLDVWFARLHCEVAEIKRRFGARNRDFEADTLVVAELGRANGAAAPIRALANVHTHVQAIARFHETYDYFLTPTLATPPPRLGSLSTPPFLQAAARAASKVRGGRTLKRTGVVDRFIAESLAWVPYTQLANMTGRPAISVPLHWTDAGLPLGVQFVGRLGADGALLQLAAQLEEARPWIQRFPAPGGR